MDQFNQIDTMLHIQHELQLLSSSFIGETSVTDSAVALNEKNTTSDLDFRISNDKKFKSFGIDLHVCIADLKMEKQILESVSGLSGVKHNSMIQEIGTSSSKTELHIKLNREKTFRNVIKMVSKQKDRFGHAEPQSKTDQLYILNPVSRQFIHKSHIEVSKDISKMKTDVDTIRVALIVSHIKKILEACGNSCLILGDHKEDEFISCIDLLSRESQTQLEKDPVEIDLIQRYQKYAEKFTRSDYRVMDALVTVKNNSNPGDDDVRIDLGQYLSHHRMRTGKDGFDKNIKVVQVKDAGKPTPCLLEAATLEQKIEAAIGHTKSFSLLHITPLKRKWETEISTLTWKLMNENSDNLEKLMLCSCGPCELGSNNGCDKFESYWRLKCEEIRESFRSRYGDEVQGNQWEQTIRNVSLACIKFDMLSIPLHNKLHLKTYQGHDTDNSCSSTSRNSLFVLYNYSRLCNLLRNYDQEVEKGNYPALPDVQNIDFTHLREEHHLVDALAKRFHGNVSKPTAPRLLFVGKTEWRILLKYLLYFPSLIRSINYSVTKSECFQIHPSSNKICTFLTNLARDLSSYYHQTKVLLDPRPHLFPVMFARIYFIIAIKTVMQNSFDLIGINPPTQM